MSLQARIEEGAGYLRETLSHAPEIGLVLGSGLGSLADDIAEASTVPYAGVPYMKSSTASGHMGCFVEGMLGGKPVLCMQGRLHVYEGYDPADIAYPIQLMAAVGVKTLIETNATGGINLGYQVGDLVAVSDHINMTGRNPLLGIHDDNGDLHLPDMSHAYTPRLRELAHEVAAERGIDLKEGVYAGMLGPSFETPAEIRMLRIIGCDVVGMSTVPEVVAAADCGLDILCISLVTNMAAGVSDKPITVEEVNEIGARRAAVLSSLVEDIVARM